MKYALFCAEDISLGLSYISAHLKEQGHEVELFFDPRQFNRAYARQSLLAKAFNLEGDIIRRVKKYDPDVCLFSCVTATYRWALGMAEKVKQEVGCRIIFGGVHPTLVPDEVRKHGFINDVVVGDGIAYFGSSDHRVYALDVETQKTVWDRPFETGNWVWGAPAVDEERVYVGSMDHYVYAIDRETGVEGWKREVGGSALGSITLSDGVLFVGTVDRRLYALDKEHGAELWKTEELGGWVWGEALAHDGYVYFGSLDGKIHARKVSDNSSRWEPVQVDGAVRAGPALLDTHLIVGTESGAIYTIDAETGKSQERSVAAGAVLSTPAIEQGIVYIGTTAGNVYALDFTRGIDPFVWTYPPKEE